MSRAFWRASFSSMHHLCNGAALHGISFSNLLSVVNNIVLCHSLTANKEQLVNHYRQGCSRIPALCWLFHSHWKITKSRMGRYKRAKLNGGGGLLAGAAKPMLV